MAERRTDEASAAPRGSGSSSKDSSGKGWGTAKPGDSSKPPSKQSSSSPSSTSTSTDSASTDSASTDSASTDSADSGQDTRGRGTERFAAALAKAREGQRGGKEKRAAAGKPAPARQSPRRVRRARLRLTHVDPWSVMKTAFLLSIAIGIVTIVAVGIVWSVLGAAGVWDSIDRAVADVAGDTGSDFAIQDYLGTSRIMGITMLLAVVDVFLITVVATLAAFLYNLAAALLGGLEVVFAEEER